MSGTFYDKLVSMRFRALAESHESKDNIVWQDAWLSLAKAASNIVLLLDGIDKAYVEAGRDPDKPKLTIVDTKDDG